MAAPHRWLNSVWYGSGKGGWLLLPLTGLYWAITALRGLLYRAGIFKTARARVPVIVVGNVTVGGTGKTPTVIWLARELQSRGFRPGVVSRGYGGKQAGTSMRVDKDSDPAVVGDEPVLLARRSDCPVVVDADRIRAAAMLVDDGVDVIITDDGLQHLRLQRDFEICIIDGSRGLGNRRLLPAGPLRESVDRLRDVDLVLVNGEYTARHASDSAAEQNAVRFDLCASDACRLNGTLARPLENFKNTTVHAVAGIGNPGRFFDLLRGYEIQVIEHAMPDHFALRKSDLEFGDDFAVVMTEKDAVKIGTQVADKLWSVAIDLEMSASDSAPILAQIESRLRSCQEQE